MSETTKKIDYALVQQASRRARRVARTTALLHAVAWELKSPLSSDQLVELMRLAVEIERPWWRFWR